MMDTRQKGSALLLVVLILLVLSGLGIAMLTLTDSDREGVIQDNHYKDALYVAEMGLRIGEVTLFSQNPATATQLMQHTSISQTAVVTPAVPVFPQSPQEYNLAHLGTYLTAIAGGELANQPAVLPASPSGKATTEGFYSLYVRNNPADTSVSDGNPGTVAQLDTDTVVNLVSVGWVTQAGRVLSVKILEEEYSWIGLAESLSTQEGKNEANYNSGQYGES